MYELLSSHILFTFLFVALKPSTLLNRSLSVLVNPVPVHP